MQIIGAIIGIVIGIAVVAAIVATIVIATVYAWMWVFVDWLRFDYVTASNIYFIFVFVGGILNALGSFTRSAGLGFFALIIAIVLAPLLVSTGLGVYEAWNDPTFSKETNVVASYRQVVSGPITFLTAAISNVGPMTASAVTYIEAHPLLTHIVSSVITTLIGALPALMFKKSS